MKDVAKEMNLLAFEVFEVGQKAAFGRYDVTEAEIIEFASKYDAQFFHLDHEAAKKSLFGGLCASGWHTCAMTMAMLVENMKTRGGSLGSPGVNNLRWLKPVYPGDVLSIETEVVETKRSKSRPEIGVVSYNLTVLNQNGEKVMTFLSKGIYPTS